MSQPNDPRRADDLTETSDSPERLRALEAAAPQPPDAGQSARKMPPFVVRVLLAGLALTALGLWWLIWGAGPNLPQQTLVAQRGSDGAFPESTGTASGLSGRLSAREANKSTSTISSQSSGGEARLRARSAVVYVATPDLLAQRVAHELFKELQKSSRFDSLTYHPPGEKFTQGELLPDLYLSVGVKSLKESGVAPYKTLEAEVQVTLGNLPARSSHSYMDTLSPPVVNHHWNSTINYSAREVGLETASARYEAVGRDLAADVAKSINEYLAKLAEKHGEWREDPLEFFPAFAPGPELPILQTLHAEKITSGHGFLTKNVTVWKTTLPRAEPDVVKRIAQDLESAGWKDATKRIEANDGYLRVEKEWQSQIFEVFRPSEFQPQEDEKADPREWYCVYTHRMTQTEASAALAKLFDRAAPESMLVPFSQWWYLDEERVAKYFAEHPPKLSGSILYLARRKIAEKQPEEVKRLLLRGDAIRRILDRNTGQPDEVKKLGKEVGLLEYPKLPDLTALQPGDVIDAAKDLPLTRKVQLDETVIVLVDVKDDEQKFIGLTPIRRSDARDAFTFRVRETTLGDGSSSWSDWTSGDAGDTPSPFTLNSRGGKTVNVKSHWSPDAKTFEITFE